MKRTTKRKLEQLFAEIYPDREQADFAVRDAIRAYSFVKQQQLKKSYE